MPVTADVQSLSPGDIIDLFDLDCSRIGGGTFRFVSGNLGDRPVRWRGNEYLAIPVQASGFEKSGRGTLPTPTISIAATDLVVAAAISLDDLRGATVTRWRTFTRYLDNGTSPDSNQHFVPEIFRVERKVRHNTGTGIIEWELSASIDQEGKKIPGRVAQRDHCAWKYRTPTGGGTFNYDGVECPYTGSAYFKDDDVPTGDSRLDACSKRLSGCKLRFGENNPLPIGAFPGLGSARY